MRSGEVWSNMKKHVLPFSVEAILAEDGGKYEKKPAVMSGEGNVNIDIISC